MSLPKIPFNKPGFAGGEFEALAQAMRRGHISGNGHFTQECQSWLEKRLGVGKALLTTSCTHALEMAALLLDLGPDDEVIVPSFTFVSTVNAFVLRGAKPVFIDVRPDTLNFDETRLERLITRRTKAIFVVHYAGVACEMDAIMKIARKRGIPVVEDNAHGLFGKYKGKPLGTFGAMSALSFHETKNIICGEGGALLINDPRYIDRAEILREKGTNRSLFFRGLVDKYSWVDMGSSYVPSDLLAAFLHAQLRGSRRIQSLRRGVWERYRSGLGAWARSNGVGLPTVPERCEQSYHMFYLMLPTLGRRQSLMAHLKSRGILSVFHYLPLNLSVMGRKLGGQPGDCPVTEDISDRILRLPFYKDLTRGEQNRVVRAILDWSGK